MPEPRREVDEAPDRPERDARGRLLPGHSVTVKHGRFSQQAMARMAPLVAELEESIVADLGGPGEVSEVLVSTIRDYARAAVLSDVVWGNFVVASPETRRRKSAFNELLRVWDKKTTLARLIGLERKSRAIKSPEAWLRSHRPAERRPIDVPAEPAGDSEGEP